ncbi:hypothetical protein GCM10022244_50300 [Streptomyces gulbargensis]|uniref:FAD dependent oxidoreductase domain-containing protein n=1 Tax=Streptomyces gulbargensis TaxID=364901 RepID=A0ABP7N3C3_9ACTN
MTGPRDDLLIIGGGMVGTTAAWAAARHAPGSRIVLVDRGEPGGGTSAHSAALIVPYAPDAAHRALMGEAAALLAETPLAGFQRTVPMLFVTAQDNVTTAAGRFLGSPLPVADATRLAALHAAYPDLRLGRGETVLDAGDRCTLLDVPAWITAVLDGTTPDAPAPRVLTRTTVTRVRADGDGWAADTADGSVLRARRVLLATGPWPAPEIVCDADAVTTSVTDPVTSQGEPSAATTTKLVAALHLAPGALRDRPHTPGVVFLDDDLFVLPGATPLVSFAARRILADGEDPRAGLPADEKAEGVRALARRLPALARQVTGGRCFPDTYTPGRLPVVDRPAAAPGLVRITGCSGSGVRFAPALAARAVRLLDTPHDQPTTPRLLASSGATS